MGAAEDGRVGGDGSLSEAAVCGPPGHGGDGIRPEAVVDGRGSVRGPGGIEQVGKRSDLKERRLFQHAQYQIQG